MSGPENYDRFWSLQHCYSQSSPDDKGQYAVQAAMSNERQLTAIYHDYSLNIFAGDETTVPEEIVRLAPDTYVLQSTVHLGILSFDNPVGRWWVLTFEDEQSAADCALTLCTCVGVTLADIEKLLLDRARLENSIVQTIMNPTFLNFVTNMGNDNAK